MEDEDEYKVDIKNEWDEDTDEDVSECSIMVEK